MAWATQRFRILDEPLARVRCKRCRAFIQWATREGGAKLPISPTAFTYTTETTLRGVRYRVIGGDDVHHCRRSAQAETSWGPS